jgi:hypothetical protein
MRPPVRIKAWSAQGVHSLESFYQVQRPVNLFPGQTHLNSESFEEVLVAE